MTATAFSTLPLPPALLSNLESLGYQHMTPIQAASLPVVLAGQDLMAKAETGSGKTAAFGIPILQTLTPQQFSPQALILCPTRELCSQVCNELRKLARYQDNIKILPLSGGRPIGPQIGSLKHGAHILVATPGRLADHLRKQTVDLGSIKTVVLDEADRMLDMGFLEAVESILQQTPKKRQTLLFSATYPEAVKQLSQRLLRDGKLIDCTSEQNQPNIEQRFLQIVAEQRLTALQQLLGDIQPSSAIVFCNTRQRCNEVTQTLNQQHRQALALHGEMEQSQRDQTLTLFANGSIRVLVTTDVAARGIDIQDLDLVINYELPRQAETYTHRIGRTGRAGNQGLVINLFSESEGYKLADIAASDIEMFEPVESKIQPLAPANMATLCLNAGKKEKLRAGDILGALTQAAGLSADQVGKIKIEDHCSYVAIDKSQARQVLNKLMQTKVKGRKIRIRKV